MRESHSRKDQKMASLLVQNTWLMTLIVTINRSYNNFPLSCFFFLATQVEYRRRIKTGIHESVQACLKMKRSINIHVKVIQAMLDSFIVP